MKGLFFQSLGDVINSLRSTLHLFWFHSAAVSLWICTISKWQNPGLGPLLKALSIRLGWELTFPWCTVLFCFNSWPAAAWSQPVAERWKGWKPVRHCAAKRTKGGAADEGLVGELEWQEGAAGALQSGHQRRPSRFPHQITPAAPGLSGPGRPEHGGRVLSPQGTTSYLIPFNCSDKIVYFPFAFPRDKDDDVDRDHYYHHHHPPWRYKTTTFRHSCSSLFFFPFFILYFSTPFFLSPNCPVDLPHSLPPLCLSAPSATHSARTRIRSSPFWGEDSGDLKPPWFWQWQASPQARPLRCFLRVKRPRPPGSTCAPDTV